MIRISGLLFFCLAALAVSDCQAQLFRGRLFRSHRQTKTVQPRETRQAGRFSQNQADHEYYQLKADHQKAITRSQRFENPSDPYPRYIGGFHSSFFHNIGIPSGDIGLRGNGLYARPW